MISHDLKLLVDVAWANRASQTPYALVKGQYAAADRLVARNLLVNAGGGDVGITSDGERLINSFVERIKRVGRRKEDTE